MTKLASRRRTMCVEIDAAVQERALRSIAYLDAECRKGVLSAVMCTPAAGEFPSLYLETADAADEGLIPWLVIAREACGIQGAGHA